MARDGPNQHAYWTQPNFLTHVDHLLKLQDIQNLSQTSSLIDRICLLKLTRNGLFKSTFYQIILKFEYILRQIQQNWLEMQSHCVTDNTSPWFNK